MINEISFSEVYEIILHMDKKISQKIPDKFINFIKQNKKDNYKKVWTIYTFLVWYEQFFIKES